MQLIRLPQVLEKIPVAPSTWWRGVKEGRYPQPVKLGPRTTAWKAPEIDALANGEWPPVAVANDE